MEKNGFQQKKTRFYKKFFVKVAKNTDFFGLGVLNIIEGLFSDKARLKRIIYLTNKKLVCSPAGCVPYILHINIFIIFFLVRYYILYWFFEKFYQNTLVDFQKL